jgi:hypothetical protein
MNIGWKKVRHEESGDFQFCGASSRTPTIGNPRHVEANRALSDFAFHPNAYVTFCEGCDSIQYGEKSCREKGTALKEV